MYDLTNGYLCDILEITFINIGLRNSPHINQGIVAKINKKKSITAINNFPVGFTSGCDTTTKNKNNGLDTLNKRTHNVYNKNISQRIKKKKICFVKT